MPADKVIPKNSAATDNLRSGEPVGAPEFRPIFENASTGAVETTSDGRILSANAALARMLGYESVEELMRTAPSIASHYADGAERAKFVRKLHEHGAVVGDKIRMRRRDGNLIWVSVDVQVVQDKQGMPHYEGTVEDLTERKQSAAAVQEAARRALRRRRIKVGAELASLVGASALIYGLAAQFEWFERIIGWILVNRGPHQMDEFMVAAIFFVAGLLIFAFRRWRETDAEVTAQSQAQESLRAEVAERRRAEAALNLPSAALSAAANAIVITDRNGTIAWVNPAFTTLTGYTFAESVGKNPRDLVKSNQQEPAVYRNLWETILAGRVWRGELVNRRKDGSLYYEDQTITPVRDGAGRITHFIAIKQDLTARKEAEETLRKSNRHLRAVSECNQVLVRATDATRLLHDICRIVVEHAGYRLAWVGFAENDAAKSVRPVAHHGFEEGYLDTLHLTWADTERGRGPTGTAIRTGQPCAVQNIREDPRFLPWRDEALRRGCLASIAVPLAAEGRVLGTLNIYAAELGAFNAEEIGLLTELADDLAYGITSLRTRGEREKIEAALQESEQRFRAIFNKSALGIALVSPAGRPFLTNAACQKMMGRTAEELGQLVFTEFTHPEDRDKDMNLFRQLIAGERDNYQIEKRYVRKEGQLVWTSLSVTLLRGPAGQPQFALAMVEDITERQRAEEAIRQAEAKFHSIFDNAIEGIYQTTRDGKFLAANPAMARILGYASAAELIAQRTDIGRQGYADPARRGEFKRAMEQDNVVKGFESEILCKDGRRKWVSENARAVRDAHGGVLYFEGSLEDITARKQAEAARRESEERYRLLFEHAPDAIFALTPTGAITSLNQAFETITGWPPAEWRGRPFQELIHPGDLSTVTELFQVVLRDRRTTTFELRVRTTAGGFRNVEFTGFFNQLSDGRIEVQGIGRDITERKADERQLREQNEILSNSHEGVIIVNLANQVTLWNRGAEEIFGWTAAEALGRVPEQLLGIDDPGAVSALRSTADRSGFWNGELRAQARDGRRLILDCRVTLVRDKTGQPRARLNFLSDITEKKQFEEKFLRAQRLESLGMLAAGIAHDLNNVLAPIVFAAPLLRSSLTAARDLKILNTLEQSAGRGAGLVKQILGFAHSATGELRLTQVKHLARDIINMIEETFPKNIRLEQQIPSDLWPVQGNATQIHQVLLNLCVNARDAMPTGGTLRIVAANRRLDAVEAGAMPGARPGDWLMLEIGDTGTGIAPEVLELIWTPFFTTKAMGKGTGLGLSTVRGIVANHHGFVELDTKVGRGTTFRVFLPAFESESPQPEGAKPLATPNGHGELILVVDDDQLVRDVVSEILGRHGYHVASCVDGVEALALFNARPGEVSLVVTDADMPRLGGAALARALLQLRPDLRLVAMSGGISRNATSGAAVPELQKLAHAFLLKPFSQEELLGTVHRLLHPSEKH